MVDINALERRRSAFESERSGVEQVWELIEKFFMPFRGSVYTGGAASTEGEVWWRRRYLYDGTAAIASQNLAANLNSGLTNPLFQWFLLQTRYKPVMDQPGVREWLQEVAQLAFGMLQDSNFNLRANECYTDLPSYGTAAQVQEVNENDKGEFDNTVFSSVPIGEYVFELDTDDTLLRWWRKYKWTAHQIVDKFGDDAPQRFKEMVEKQPDNTEKFEIVLAIYKRTGIKETNTFKFVANKAERMVGQVYYCVDTKEQIGEEGGYHEMPVYVPRFRTTSGSIWGNSPAMLVLSNVLTLNELEEFVVRGTEKNVDPPTIGRNRNVVGNMDLRAGGHTVVKDIKQLTPFLSGADIGAGHVTNRDLRDMINRAFYMDQLQLKESPAMTATEVNARFQLMQRLMGPTLHRLKEDWLDPVVQRTIGILARYKKLPPMPQALLDLNNPAMDIIYAGQMAKAQQEMTAQAIEGWVSGIAALSEGFPKARYLPNIPKIGTTLAELRGVPADLINEDSVIKKMEKDEQEARARATQQQEVAQGVQNIETAARAVSHGSRTGTEG